MKKPAAAKPKAKAKAKIAAKPEVAAAKAKIAAKRDAADELERYEGSAPPPYPGTKTRPPIYWKDVSIYTSETTGSWRVKKRGERMDNCVKFSDDPTEAWKKVLTHCRNAFKRKA